MSNSESFEARLNEVEDALRRAHDRVYELDDRVQELERVDAERITHSVERAGVRPQNVGGRRTFTRRAADRKTVVKP